MFGSLDNLEIKRAIILLTLLLVKPDNKSAEYKQLKEIVNKFGDSLRAVEEYMDNFNKTGKL